MFPISRYTLFVTGTSEIRASVCHWSESQYQVCYSHVSESVPGLSLVPWHTGLSLVHLESVLVCQFTHVGICGINLSLDVPFRYPICHSFHVGIRLSLVPNRHFICRSSPHRYLPFVPKGTRLVTRPTSARDFSLVPHWYLICHSSRVPYLVSHSTQDIGT